MSFSLLHGRDPFLCQHTWDSTTDWARADLEIDLNDRGTGLLNALKIILQHRNLLKEIEKLGYCKQV